MTILPLHARPQHAEQVTDWLWQAFGGDGLPRAFFASIIEHSQRPDALPLTFIAVEGDKVVGTVGLWRCDLISRQDLWPSPPGRGLRSCTSIRPVGIFTNALAGSISAMPWITRTPPSIFIVTI